MLTVCCAASRILELNIFCNISIFEFLLYSKWNRRIARAVVGVLRKRFSTSSGSGVAGRMRIVASILARVVRLYSYGLLSGFNIGRSKALF